MVVLLCGSGEWLLRKTKNDERRETAQKKARQKKMRDCERCGLRKAKNDERREAGYNCEPHQQFTDFR